MAFSSNLEISRSEKPDIGDWHVSLHGICQGPGEKHHWDDRLGWQETTEPTDGQMDWVKMEEPTADATPNISGTNSSVCPQWKVLHIVPTDLSSPCFSLFSWHQITKATQAFSRHFSWWIKRKQATTVLEPKIGNSYNCGGNSSNENLKENKGVHPTCWHWFRLSLFLRMIWQVGTGVLSKK